MNAFPLITACGLIGAWRVKRRAALLAMLNPCWHADTCQRMALVDLGFRG